MADKLVCYTRFDSKFGVIIIGTVNLFTISRTVFSTLDYKDTKCTI